MRCDIVLMFILLYDARATYLINNFSRVMGIKPMWISRAIDNWEQLNRLIFQIVNFGVDRIEYE